MNMKFLITVLAATSMGFGCKKDEEKAAAPAPTPEAAKTVDLKVDTAPKEEPPVETEHAMPAFAAVVMHKVADFDKWKLAFDADMEHRKGAGILGHHLSRDAADPNMVTIYLPMNETDAFNEMLTSEDMKKTMAAAGVLGEPKVMMIKPIEGKPVMDRDVIGAVIVHEVEDYDAWKQGFDAHAADRAGAGVVGWAVNRSVENDHQVIVLLQTETAEELNAFLASPMLKEAMAKAGVKGEPTIMMSSQSPGVMY